MDSATNSFRQSPIFHSSWQICRPPIVPFLPLCSYSQEISQIYLINSLSLTPHPMSQLLPQTLPGNTSAMLARESGGLFYLSLFSAISNPGVLTPPCSRLPFSHSSLPLFPEVYTGPGLTPSFLPSTLQHHPSSRSSPFLSVSFQNLERH